MIDKKHYLIKLTESNGDSYWLRNNCRVFHWCNHGKDKEYQSLAPAIKMATKIHQKFKNTTSKISVVKVTYELCNPEIPDGFYRPVYNTELSL